MNIFTHTISKRHLKLSVFVSILLLGIFLRFYKLDWGEGNFFHPDEYHIVIAVNRLNFPTNTNPELFSYGSFSVYLIYFTKLILALNTPVFLIGRFYSALFSTFTLIIVYFISKVIIKGNTFSTLSLFFTAISPGLVQQAHFATPESILTFWLFATCFFLLKYIKLNQQRYLIFLAISFGFAMATKLTGLIFLPIILFTMFAKILTSKSIKSGRKFARLVISLIFILSLSFTVFFISFPHALLDYKNFSNSMNYETAVGRGTQLVFYTRQFIGTLPLSFQITKILPYALGLPVEIFGVLGFILLMASLVSNLNQFKTNEYQVKLVVFLAFCLLFFPNAYLFAKWTRFIVPTFPYYCIFTVYFFYKLINAAKSPFLKYSAYLLLITTIMLSSVWSGMFFSIYVKHDVRVMATSWVNENIAQGSIILTESGNMLEVPLSGNFQKSAFDFYHLDEDVKLQKELPELLVQADYFIIQSRRIFADHQSYPNLFPITSSFYDYLFSGDLGFEKIAEFSSFPKLAAGPLKLEIPDEYAEETWTVFDHPVIRVYKKAQINDIKYYEKALKI